MEHEKKWNFLLGQKCLFKKTRDCYTSYLIPEKISKGLHHLGILWWVIKHIAFDFDIMHVKGNIIPHVDAQSRPELGNEKIEKHENARGKILYGVKTDASKQVSRTEFSRNGEPKTEIIDNEPEFCDDNLS